MYASALILGLAASALGVSARPSPARMAKRDEASFNNGFPKPSAQQLLAIEEIAGGTLTNSTPPANASSFAETFFTVVAHGEGMESFFFRDFAWNITNGVKGYEVPHGFHKDEVIDNFARIQAIEQLHTINANNILNKFFNFTITPCTRYNFPVHDFQSGLQFAETLTGNVFGALGFGALNLGINGDTGFIRAVVATATEEGEQQGYFRTLQHKPASGQPFTGLSNAVVTVSAFSHIADLTSCPDIGRIPIKPLPPLTPIDTFETVDKTIRYTIDASIYNSGTNYFIAIMNSLNVPVVVPTTFVSNTNGVVTLSAEWPYTEHLLNEFSTIILTNTNVGLTSIDAVTATGVAVAGPAFVVLN